MWRLAAIKIRPELRSPVAAFAADDAWQARLDRCRQLPEEFQDGPSAKHIGELEAALVDDLLALAEEMRSKAESCEDSEGRQALRKAAETYDQLAHSAERVRTFQDYADEQRAIAEKLHRKMN